MGGKFVDYYEVCGLNPDKSREDNYADLLEMHHQAGRKRGADAELELLQLNKAMSIFKNEAPYREFRVEWEQRRRARPQATGESETSQGVEGASQGSFWSVLGKVALKGIETYLENKQSEATQPAQPSPRSGLGSSLSGWWRDSAGNAFHLQHSGNVITVQGVDGYGTVIVEGQGIINGRSIQYQARNLAGQVGRGVFTLSNDGMVIDGQITWWHFNMPTGTFQVRLFRQ